MDNNTFVSELESFVQKYQRLSRDLFDANPQWLVATGFQLIHIAIGCLRSHIEDPRREHVSWDNPVTMVPIPVEVTDEFEPLPFTVSEDDLQNRKTRAQALLRALARTEICYLLRAWTRGVVLIKYQGQYYDVFTTEIAQEIRDLPRRRRRKREDELVDPEPWTIGLNMRGSEGGQEVIRVSADLEIKLSPLYVDYELEQCCYPVWVSLSLSGAGPQTWSAEMKAKLWEGLLKEVEARIPEENRECLAKAIQDSRLVEVLVSELVSPDYEDEYRDVLQTYASCQAHHLEKTGDFFAVKHEFDLHRAKLKLTVKQERDYQRYKYLRYDRIHIPGTGRMKRSNRVLINDREIKVGDSVFPLLLRFVVELKKRKGGWVSIESLDEENIVPGPIEYRPYSRLREALKPVLPERAAYDLIQADEAGHYRLSVHPDLLTYDRQRLLEHDNPDVVKVANQLPRSGKLKR